MKAMDITVLVPAYKSQYLPELLRALQSQTLPPARVVFSDDSPDQAFQRALATPEARAAWPALHLEVIPGPRNGAWANFRHLLQHYQGETAFFHLQLDDDIPYPQFYERHAQAHALAQGQAAVSRRWTALESGEPTGSLPVPESIHGQLQRLFALGPDVLFPSTVAASNNWLGEFSNATFRAGMREELLSTRLAGVSFTGLEDIGAFLVACRQAPLIYINEHLGFFRTSPGQNTSLTTGRIFKLGLLAWVALALASHRLGYLDAGQMAAVAQRIGGTVLQHYRAVDPAMCGVAELGLRLGQGAEAEADYLAAWHAYSGALEMPA